MGKDGLRKVVKCEGRFPQLRTCLYEEVFPLVLEDRQNITEKDLIDIWALIQDDISRFDFGDSYYDSQSDLLRKNPSLDHLSLVPLIERPGHFLDPNTIVSYILSMGNSSETAKKLVLMNTHPESYLTQTLHKEAKDVIFPGGKSLVSYCISGNMGIGTLSPGGTQGGGVRSDSPFLLEVYHNQRGESNLAAVVGFWVQDNSMLVSQIQSCRNASLPEGVPLGVCSLRIAESIASLVGLGKVVTYTARNHPIFSQHPSSWGQLGKDFVAIYDGSAAKLGYSGGRCSNSCHEKSL